MDGMEIIKQVREWGRGQEADKVQAFELGADDYLTKPFSAGELVARIKVALRHAHRTSGDAPFVYDYDGLLIDTDARRVWIDGEDVHLTPFEYKLLIVLGRNASKVLTHSVLLNEVWGKFDRHLHSIFCVKGRSAGEGDRFIH